MGTNAANTARMLAWEAQGLPVALTETQEALLTEVVFEAAKRGSRDVTLTTGILALVFSGDVAFDPSQLPENVKELAERYLERRVRGRGGVPARQGVCRHAYVRARGLVAGG